MWTSPESAVRQVRAAASAAGLRCQPVSWPDAAAALTGASLWCALTGHHELSLVSRWPGLELPVAVWGVRILHRGAGIATDARIPDDDGWGANPPTPAAAARVLAAAAAADRALSEMPVDDTVAVWAAVACDVCVESPELRWVGQVVAAYHDQV